MNLPNSVTLLRILLIPLLVFFLLSKNIPDNNLIAVVIFVIVAFTDYIDGYLARKLNQETMVGKFLDPLADKMLVISALICLVDLRMVSSIPVIIVMIRDLAVIGLRLTASSNGNIIAADTLGKYKTVLLDVAVFMLILDLQFAGTVLWTGVALSVVSGIEYFIMNWGVLNGRS